MINRYPHKVLPLLALLLPLGLIGFTSTSASARVNEEEIQASLNSPTPSQMCQQALFPKVDTNNSGFVDQQELSALHLGEGNSPNMFELDINKDHFISAEEFCQEPE